MSFSPSSGFNNFVPNDLIIPREEKEMNLVLTDYIRLMVNNLNAKEVGTYDTEEFAQGQYWFNPANRQNPRSGLRKVINLQKTDGSGGSGLNDFTLTNPQTIAHGIDISPQTVFTRISGAASDPSTQYISLPFVDMTGAGNNIELCVDATNVILRSTGDFSAFTTAYVILEYLQN